MTAPQPIFWSVFDGAADRLIPHVAAELARRDAAVASLKSPLARLQMRYRLRPLPAQAAQTPLPDPRVSPMTILRHLTHNADVRFRLHDVQDAPGFTLVEGLRLRDDINQIMLPVTRICINAGLRLFTFYAGDSRLRFTVQGPDSGLRVREAWREDGNSGWHRRDTGTPHAIETPDHPLQRADMPAMLARLHPGLPDALADRRFSASWEFRTGLTGSNVARIAATAEAPA